MSSQYQIKYFIKSDNFLRQLCVYFHHTSLYFIFIWNVQFSKEPVCRGQTLWQSCERLGQGKILCIPFDICNVKQLSTLWSWQVSGSYHHLFNCLTDSDLCDILLIPSLVQSVVHESHYSIISQAHENSFPDITGASSTCKKCKFYNSKVLNVYYSCNIFVCPYLVYPSGCGRYTHTHTHTHTQLGNSWCLLSSLMRLISHLQCWGFSTADQGITTHQEQKEECVFVHKCIQSLSLTKR